MVRLDEVRAERVRAGLTQEQVAVALGCSSNTYRKKEKGKTPFDVIEVERFCKICGIEDMARKSYIFLA